MEQNQLVPWRCLSLSGIDSHPLTESRRPAKRLWRVIFHGAASSGKGIAMWCSCLLLLATEVTLLLPSPPGPGDPNGPIVEPTRGVPFSKWLSSGDYQQLFNKNLPLGLYPVTVEGRQGKKEPQYRAQFVPRPEGLSFVSFHGATDASHRVRTARYRQLGYREVCAMSFVDANGVRRHCGTWVRGQPKAKGK
jgi:hypothetical protein